MDRRATSVDRPRDVDTWYEAVATFTDRNDAVALMQLCEEMGVRITVRQRYKPREHKAQEQRLCKLLIKQLVPNKVYNKEDIAEWCELLDYKPTSASPVISKLCQEGLLIRVARGEYVLAVPVETL